MIGLIARPYAATIVSSTGWSATFPASNVLNNDYGRVGQTTGGASLILDLGESKPIDAVALLWNTGAATDYCDVRVSDDPAFPAGSTTSRAVLLRTGLTARESLSQWKGLATFPTVTGRYVAMNFFVSNGRPFTLSRVVIAKSAQFAIGPQKASLGAKDMNANVTTEIGEMRSQEDQNLIRPVISLSFDYAKQSEMEQVLGQYTLTLGVSKPLLICTDLTTAYIQDNVAFGRPEKVLTHESTIYDVWSFEAVVTSLGI